MQSNQMLTGIVPIPVTTFTDEGELDLEGLRSQVEFCLGVGADGVLYPGVVSEFYTLTDVERFTAVECIVEAVAGRAPVAVGVSATSTAAAVAFAEHAGTLPVDAVMTMAPFVQHFFTASTDFVTSHVRRVAEAAALPLIFQNARIGHAVSVPTLASIVEAVPQVRYIKQETNPATQDITAVIESMGDRLHGVFGGIGGVYLPNELDRGAVGSMPSPAFADRIVEALAAYRAAGADAAQQQLDPLGSLFTRELLYNVAFIKEVLRERGIIKSPAVRIPAPTLDAVDRADMRRMLEAATLL